MEEKRIETVRNCSKPKLVRKIQVFLRFANLYYCFIQGFSKIAKSLTLMIKTANLFKNSLILKNVVEDSGLIVDDSRNNNLGKYLVMFRKSKIIQNYLSLKR